MTSVDIEISLSNYFGPRQNFIVPNVSYGLGIHEVDLLVVSQAGYCTEVEIKTSVSDLKADLKKEHGHRSNLIKYFYFAVPEKLKDKALELIPERAGLFVVKDINFYWHNCRIEKSPIVNKAARALKSDELIKLGHLAAMRIWTLKERLYQMKKESK